MTSSFFSSTELMPHALQSTTKQEFVLPLYTLRHNGSADNVDSEIAGRYMHPPLSLCERAVKGRDVQGETHEC